MSIALQALQKDFAFVLAGGSFLDLKGNTPPFYYSPSSKWIANSESGHLRYDKIPCWRPSAQRYPAGIVLEPLGTNIIPNNTSFDNSSWVRGSQVQVLENVTESPFSGYRTDRVSLSSSQTLSYTATVSAGTTYCLQVVMSVVDMVGNILGLTDSILVVDTPTSVTINSILLAPLNEKAGEMQLLQASFTAISNSVTISFYAQITATLEIAAIDLKAETNYSSIVIQEDTILPRDAQYYYFPHHPLANSFAWGMFFDIAQLTPGATVINTYNQGAVTGQPNVQSLGDVYITCRAAGANSYILTIVVYFEANSQHFVTTNVSLTSLNNNQLYLQVDANTRLVTVVLNQNIVVVDNFPLNSSNTQYISCPPAYLSRVDFSPTSPIVLSRCIFMDRAVSTTTPITINSPLRQQVVDGEMALFFTEENLIPPEFLVEAPLSLNLPNVQLNTAPATTTASVLFVDPLTGIVTLDQAVGFGAGSFVEQARASSNGAIPIQNLYVLAVSGNTFTTDNAKQVHIADQISWGQDIYNNKGSTYIRIPSPLLASETIQVVGTNTITLGSGLFSFAANSTVYVEDHYKAVGEYTVLGQVSGGASSTVLSLNSTAGIAVGNSATLALDDIYIHPNNYLVRFYDLQGQPLTNGVGEIGFKDKLTLTKYLNGIKIDNYSQTPLFVNIILDIYL